MLHSVNSPGSYNMPSRLDEILHHWLTYRYFYEIICKGIVTYRTKLAKNIPVYNKSVRHFPTNYTPISHLIAFDKLIDKKGSINRLYTINTDNKILYYFQFRFTRNNSSTLIFIDVIFINYRRFGNKDTVVIVFVFIFTNWLTFWWIIYSYITRLILSM